MEVFDKDGNPVTGIMSQAEVDALVAAQKAEWEKANVPPAPVTPPAPTADEPPAWAKELIGKVETLSGNQKAVVVSDFVKVLEADKQPIFTAKFDQLTGYPETPEGMQQRASDAYLLTTGQRYETSGVNMQNIVAANGSPVRPGAPATEVDKAFQQTFGITDEDVKKHSSNPQ
jgi:hypothetical protein